MNALDTVVATTPRSASEHPSGALDAVTAPDVRRRLCTWVGADVDAVLVDLTEVTEMDAAGLSAIVMARRELRRHGIDLLIVGATAPGVRRTLAVTRFARVFDLAEVAA